jgi:ribonuclease HI
VRVTIIADASYCPRTGAAGYGVWAASSRGKRSFKGQLAVPKDNNDAEMMAIVNGVAYALKFGIAMPGDLLLIQSDSTTAIITLNTGEAKDAATETIVDTFGHFIEKYALKVEFRHVKGHTNSELVKDARFASNRLCDKHAKEEMRNA